MGKPFARELSDLKSTWEWARGADIGPLSRFFTEAAKTPLFCVGVGGSHTAARFAAQIFESSGGVAITKTTLEFLESGTTLRGTSVALFTGGGRNLDIIGALEFALEKEADRVLVVCAREKSPIAQRARGASSAVVYEFTFPARRDGFLATNSLLAICALLARILTPEIVLRVEPDAAAVAAVTKWGKGNKTTILALHSGWASPAAMDLESKCSEAALAHVLLSDFRHFGHGRHVWLAKRPTTSGVIALVTPENEALARRTLDILPADVAKIELHSALAGPAATIELLIHVFYLSEALGKVAGIDPGRPGVPPFGRKLYHLKTGARSHSGTSARIGDVATARKEAALGTKIGLDPYNAFLKRLESIELRGIVFDFDGTLCRSSERRTGVNVKLIPLLRSLLKAKLVVGIATGRGRSARKDLRMVIPRRYWNKIIVGYYNGSQIATLADAEPEASAGISRALRRVERTLRDLGVDRCAKMELRPCQLTVSELDTALDPGLVAQIEVELRRKHREVRLVHSSHSLDILEGSASKSKVVEACAAKMGGEILCIGDRGDLMGNDFELLGMPYSLSVDRVSAALDSCWNLAPAGVSCVEATQFYLSGLAAKSELATFSLSKAIAALGRIEQ